MSQKPKLNEEWVQHRMVLEMAFNVTMKAFQSVASAKREATQNELRCLVFDCVQDIAQTIQDDLDYYVREALQDIAKEGTE